MSMQVNQGTLAPVCGCIIPGTPLLCSLLGRFVDLRHIDAADKQTLYGTSSITQTQPTISRHVKPMNIHTVRSIYYTMMSTTMYNPVTFSVICMRQFVPSGSLQAVLRTWHLAPYSILYRMLCLMISCKNTMSATRSSPRRFRCFVPTSPPTERRRSDPAENA